VDPILAFLGEGILSFGYHHIHGAPVLWKVRDSSGVHKLVYISAERDVVRAYEFANGFGTASGPGGQPVDVYESYCPNSATGMPGGFLTLSANGDDPHSAILWASMPQFNQDALTNTVKGILRAYTAYPSSGKYLTELWNSDEGTNTHPPCARTTRNSPDSVGLFAKFVAPTVSDGKIYLATFSNTLAVYGLRPVQGKKSRPHPKTSTKPTFEARLQLTPPPKAAVEPGESVIVKVLTTNEGTSTWKPKDKVSLDSNSIADDWIATSERNTLTIQKPIEPRETYTFTFQIQAPRIEGRYYYDWRLSRQELKGGKQITTLFGEPTDEWAFVVERKDCADIRERADTFRSKHRSLSPALPDPSLVAEARRLVEEAKSRRCWIGR
jgi:hypothetical protein